MAHPDNRRLAFIEGAEFESVHTGHERNATIAHIKMPDGFEISARSVMVLEVDEWDGLTDEIEKLKEALESIKRISSGEDQVACDDSEGMGLIYGIAKKAGTGWEE